MSDLLTALENLPSKTLVDYLIAVVPIALSVVAIWISVSTARKQNKIAMFELRYKCISQIRTIISFDKSIYDITEPILILCMLDALWGTDISDDIGFDEKVLKSRCHQEMLLREVLQAESLFKGNFHTDLSELLRNMQTIVMGAISGEINEEHRTKFHNLCTVLREKDLPKMERQINCKNL